MILLFLYLGFCKWNLSFSSIMWMPRMLWTTRKVCKSISFPIKKTFAFSIVNQSKAGRENLHIIEKVETPSDPPGHHKAESGRDLYFASPSQLLIFALVACVWAKLSEMYDVIWIKYLKIGNCLPKYNVKFEHRTFRYTSSNWFDWDSPSCHRLKIRQQTLWLIKEYTQFWFQSDSTNNGCVAQITNQHQDDKDGQEAE